MDVNRCVYGIELVSLKDPITGHRTLLFDVSRNVCGFYLQRLIDKRLYNYISYRS